MNSNGPELTNSMREQLVLFRNLLVAWNRRFNLTAISDAEGIDHRLIGDALRMLPAVDDAIAASLASKLRGKPASDAEAIRLIDIGSGAGFPGMVLKIARPNLDVTLVEATGKKVTFLDHVIRELKLDGIQAIHSRSEELAHDRNHRVQYQIVTARAVASLPTLLEFTIPFLSMGGHGIFPKGVGIADELAMGERAAPILGARIVGSDLLPTGERGSVTRLVIAVKIELTPDRYPRRAGVPVKDPLGRVAR
jgi:16S rRNA (guanine527-N7)-methyltransferase